ncbi:LOB domain-containing protein 40 [Oryza brachyantha]|uniref:LOB domain-containing protein n=1 Tax=Oryza brachyantha TaxID=4533 RepID=J3KW27_ORYBR|nr:LOB domain-containing protein 40 [Oryza brachyantha]
MRMSCNGCRVLRKGCSDNCAIRPCLQWIRSPDAQANATVFLAKFYGRAGLINLITAGPEHVRPAIFRSLLYEACGRMLNPVYGSVGLLWSGNWQLCQSAVESVLRGMPIAQPPPSATAVPPLPTCDIRHVGRRGDHGASPLADLHRLDNSSRPKFKRPGGAGHRSDVSSFELVFSKPSAAMAIDVVRQAQPLNWAPGALSHESASHDAVPPESEGHSNDTADTVDGSHVSQSEPEPRATEVHDAGLDLTLGLQPAPVQKAEPADSDGSNHDRKEKPVELGLAISTSVAAQ